MLFSDVFYDTDQVLLRQIPMDNAILSIGIFSIMFCSKHWI